VEGDTIASNHSNRYLSHNPKTVALIGMGPSISNLFTETLTQEFAPDFADEFWTINMASNIVYSDVVFWMDDLKLQEAFKPALFSVLRRRGTPVITPTSYPEIVPNSYDYPLDAVASIGIPIFGKPYLNNGVAMAVAYAFMKGVTCLKMYGCDFSYPNRDYAESGRACVEAWVTVCCVREKLGLGPPMEVRMAPSTSLFDAVDQKGIYGYAEQPEINLPDGTKWKYVNKVQAQNYVAEDSSGEVNGSSEQLSGSLPGAESETAGANPDGANGLDDAAPPAAPRPGESVRHPG
jgi:hypothetical protein